MIITRVLFLFRLLPITLVAGLAPVGVTSAAAPSSTSTAASGTGATTSAVFHSTRMAGGTTIIDLTATVAYTGTFTGTSIVRGILIFHPDGSATFHDIETFTGTVNGKSGTVTFQLFGGAGSGGDYHGTQIIVRGTRDLA